jgi:hypothetical protein
MPATAAPEGAGEVLWNDVAYDRYPMRGVIEWNDDPRIAVVPEPGTVLLLGTGLLLLAVVGRRRKVVGGH